MQSSDVVNQAIRIHDALDSPFSLDLIVRTPRQIERGLKQDDWFLREIIEKGKTLYEGSNGPVGPARRRGSGGRKRDGHENSAATKRGVLSRATIGGEIPQGPAPGTRYGRSKDA
jgi:hypothetical protein